MGKLFYMVLVIQATILISTFSLPVSRKVCPKIGKIYGLHPEDAGCCLNGTDCRYQYLEPSQDVAERIRRLLAINDVLDNNIEIEPHGKRVHRNKRSTSKDHNEPAYNVHDNIEVERDYVDLHKYLALCQTKTKVLQPVWATSANSNKSVQLIQLKPLLEQHIEMVFCEEKETPFLNGMCKQAHKRQEVYVVDTDGHKSSYSKEVLFRQETIFVASGCKVLVNIEEVVAQLKKYTEYQKQGYGSEAHGPEGHGSEGYEPEGDKSANMEYVFLKKAAVKHGYSNYTSHPDHSSYGHAPSAEKPTSSYGNPAATTGNTHPTENHSYSFPAVKPPAYTPPSSMTTTKKSYYKQTNATTKAPARYTPPAEPPSYNAPHHAGYLEEGTGSGYDEEDDGHKGTQGKREAKIDEVSDTARIFGNGMTSESLTKEVEPESANEIEDTFDASRTIVSSTTPLTTVPPTKTTTMSTIPTRPPTTPVITVPPTTTTTTPVPTTTSTTTTTEPTTTTTLPSTTTTPEPTVITTTTTTERTTTTALTTVPTTPLIIAYVETTTAEPKYDPPAVATTTTEPPTVEPTAMYNVISTTPYPSETEGYDSTHHVNPEGVNYVTSAPGEPESTTEDGMTYANITTPSPIFGVENSVYEEEHDAGFHGSYGEEDQEDNGTIRPKYYPHIPDAATHPDRARRTEYGDPEYSGHSSGYGSDGAPPAYGLRYPGGDPPQGPRMHQKPNKIGVPVYTKESFPDPIRKYRQRQAGYGRPPPQH